MTDDDVKALIAEARVYADKIHRWAFGDDSELVDRAAVRFAVERITDALEAATVAPAVDREALATVLAAASALDGPGDETVGQFGERLADALLASSVLRDVRDVQAEALEQAAVAIRPIGPQDDWTDYATGIARGADLLELRAQAIREARSERD